MPINVTVKSDGKVNLQHLSNIAIEFCGDPEEITNKELKVFFANNYNAQQYKKIVDDYFLQYNS